MSIGLESIISQDWINVILFILGILFSIIGALIAMKVTKITDDIKTLYRLYHADKDDLTALKLKVAESYPSKADIKEMLTEFRNYLDERFNSIEKLAGYNKSDGKS